jgi:hypothetical protein
MYETESVCLGDASHLYLGCHRSDLHVARWVADESNNPIELASVSCLSQGKATVTSLKGEFKLTLHSADSVAVTFSMLGYRSKTRVLRNPKGTQTLQVVLYESARELNEVSITGQKIQSGQTQEISTKQLKGLPSTTGNAVEELIQSQAGVSTHSELSSQYNVRGGRLTRTLSTSTRWKCSDRSRAQRTAGGTFGNQPRYGGEDRILDRWL